MNDSPPTWSATIRKRTQLSELGASGDKCLLNFFLPLSLEGRDAELLDEVLGAEVLLGLLLALELLEPLPVQEDLQRLRGHHRALPAALDALHLCWV